MDNKKDKLGFKVQELPIKGTPIKTIQQYFQKGYDKVKEQIPVLGQTNSYQYLFDQAVQQTEGHVIVYQGDSEDKVEHKKYSYNQIQQLYNPLKS